MENLGQFLQEKEALFFGQSVNSLDTTEQFTERKSDIAHMKADIEAIKVEITSNCEATERLEQEVRKIYKTISNHDLDINLLKKAIVEQRNQIT